MPRIRELHEGFDAVHLGHVDVQEDEVRYLAAREGAHHLHRREFIAVAAGAAATVVAGGALDCAAPGTWARIGVSRPAAGRTHGVRPHRVRRARSGTRRTLPAQLAAQQLPVARRLRAAVAASVLHRPGRNGARLQRDSEGQSLAPEAQAEMFAALLDTLAIPAVDLVASDSGGAIAQLFDPSGPDWLGRTFPRSRGVQRIEGANLFFPEEMPDVMAEEARKLWLGGVGSER